MLEDLTLPAVGRSCKVAVVLETLDQNDQAILLQAIFSPAWPIKTLSRELRKRGLEISETPLTNHRQKNCVCFS